MFVGAVDAARWLAKAGCEVDVPKPYACARKTKPTRLRRLAMKAIVSMRLAKCVLLVAGYNTWCCAVHSVTLASKSSGELPRGPDFTCHSCHDLTCCFLPQQEQAKTAKPRHHGLLLHKQRRQALGVHLCRQRQSRECDSRLANTSNTHPANCLREMRT